MHNAVLAHGGAGSFDTKDHDGPENAVRAAISAGDAVASVVAATNVLEDDPRFNAGTGSNLRFDGKTIQMDASIMDHAGRYGAVAAIESTQHPVSVARELMSTPHDLLVGEGATLYARRRGHPEHNNRTPVAEAKYAKVHAMVRSGEIETGWCDWDPDILPEHWNFPTAWREAIGPSDTVGAVARINGEFAAALSTGGTAATLMGRVGDVPLPGCGLMAGPAGAVCVTGDGEHLARARLADKVYGWLEQGKPAQQCVDDACNMFPPDVAVGLILINETDFAGGSNLQMAWAAQEETP